MTADNPHYVELGSDDEEWLAELAPYAERFHMCLAEAGYPHAEVEIGPSGVFASGAPWDVICRAADVANRDES